MVHTSQALLCCQKRATTFISRPPAAPEPAAEPWAWFDPWPTSMWWRPELKLAHSRLVQSVGDRETRGPAPSRDNVAKQTEKKMTERERRGKKRWDTQLISVYVPIQSWKLPAVFWSQILIVLSWEDVATRAVPPGGTGRNMQQAVVWRWPLYSTTLQPGWRRSQS